MPRLLRAVAATVAIAVVWLGVTPAAHAAEAESGTVTWSAVPAGPDGPDGRSKIEREVEPGSALNEHLAVRNFSDHAVEFAVHAADGYLTPTGRFNMLQSGEISVGAGTWIDTPATVSVEPGATVVVPFTISVPDNATPGDHAAGVAASIRTDGTAPDGSSVGVESRVGFRVLIRVPGVLEPALTVTEVDGSYEQSWNPLQAGRASVRYTLTNTGNTTLLSTAAVSVGSGEGSADESVELLPGASREVESVISGVWPLFLAHLTVDAEGESVPVAGAPASATGSALLWAVPIPPLIVVVGAGLIGAALVWHRRRSRAEVELLIATAREQGARDAELAQSSASKGHAE